MGEGAPAPLAIKLFSAAGLRNQMPNFSANSVKAEESAQEGQSDAPAEALLSRQARSM